LGEDSEQFPLAQANLIPSLVIVIKNYQILPVLFELVINVALTGNLSGDMYTQAVELRMKIMTKTTIMTKANLKI
jgi:hypothetical protein